MGIAAAVFVFSEGTERIDSNLNDISGTMLGFRNVMGTAVFLIRIVG